MRPSLKPQTPGADIRSMFVLRTQSKRPPPPALVGLRVSLNAPVIAVEKLPKGPARAAILVYAGPTHLEVTVAVRSLRQGTLIHYGLEGEEVQSLDAARLADAALSFAESMGFLFDDDLVAAGAEPAELRQLCSEWLDLEAARDEAAAAPAPGSAEELGDELLLEQLAEEIPNPEPAAPASSERNGPAAPQAAAPPLSKFRGLSAQGPKRREPPAAAGPRPRRRRRPLARLSLARRSVAEEELWPSALLRLLGLF